MSRAPRSQAARRSQGDDDPATPIIHVDMDALFVLVELLGHPGLAGRPVIVGGSDDRGIVSTASYEARAFGASSATSMAEASRHYPQAVVLPVRHGLYSQVSAQVMAVLAEVIPALEKVSIDEAFLDVSGARRRMGSPVTIDRWIRIEIRRRMGVPASVGIASTKFIAKFASSHAKPDGLLLVPAAVTQDFLNVLPVGTLWGVDTRTQEVLARWEIQDVCTLAGTDVCHLERILDRAAGRHLHDLSRGVDPRRVEPVREEKSVGTETTFFENLTGREHARRVLLDQTHQCAARLRMADRHCRVTVLKARGADFTTVTRSRTLATPTDPAQDTWETVSSLCSALPTPPGGFRLLGVRAEGLLRPDDGMQLLLDEDPWRGVSEWAADTVRRRWGAHAVTPASLPSGDSPTKTPPGQEGRGRRQ